MAQKKKPIQNAKMALEPAYPFHGQSEVLLYSGQLTFESTEDPRKLQWSGQGRIYYAWEPAPVLRAEALLSYTTRVNMVGNGLQGAVVRFGRRRIENFLVSTIQGTDHGFRVFGLCNSPYRTQTRAELKKCKFHLINAPPLLGETIRLGGEKNSSWWLGRLSLSMPNWSIIIDGRTGLSKEIPELKARRAFSVSHTGVLARTGASVCRVSELEETLEMLFYFFSFCFARRVGPFLPVAFDAKDRQCWEKWDSPPVDHYAGRLLWWSSTEPEQLVAVFPGFAQRWKHATDCMRVVIGCYLEANRDSTGLDGRIVFAQTALERLSYEILVKELGALSHDAITKLAAKDQLRLLLSFMKVPTDIDHGLGALAAEATARKLESGPHALTMVRNSIAHGGTPKKPGGKLRALEKQAKVDAWRLGLKYLAFAILYYVGYTGAVQDLASADQKSIAVPWT